MDWIGAIGHGLLLVLILTVHAGGVALLLVNGPGTWVVLGSVIVYGLLTGWQAVGVELILALLVLAIFGEVIEFFASAVGASRFGASRGGSICALIGVFPGVIVGSLLFPVIGTIVGAFVGAFLGAFLWELGQRRPAPEAWRAGIGAFVGRTGALVAKVLIALTMSGAFIVALIMHRGA